MCFFFPFVFFWLLLLLLFVVFFLSFLSFSLLLFFLVLFIFFLFSYFSSSSSSSSSSSFFRFSSSFFFFFFRFFLFSLSSSYCLFCFSSSSGLLCFLLLLILLLVVPWKKKLMLICLDLFFFFFCLFVFVTSCAWNHYKTSGFRHMSKKHPSVWAWNHYKNSGCRHNTPKHAFIFDLPPFLGSADFCLKPHMPETTIFIVVSGTWARANFWCDPQTTIKIVVWGTAPKSKIRRTQPKKSLNACRNLALRRSTQRRLGKISFFVLLRPTSRNPYFYSVFDTSQSGILKNALFWKPLKNRDRKKKCIFDIFEHNFAGHETPIFVVFGRPTVTGVQLSSLEMTSLGFN